MTNKEDVQPTIIPTEVTAVSDEETLESAMADLKVPDPPSLEKAFAAFQEMMRPK